jgi:hypothetical protein
VKATSLGRCNLSGEAGFLTCAGEAPVPPREGRFDPGTF